MEPKHMAFIMSSKNMWSKMRSDNLTFFPNILYARGDTTSLASPVLTLPVFSQIYVHAYHIVKLCIKSL